MKTLIIGYKGFIGRALLEQSFTRNLASQVLLLKRDSHGTQILRLTDIASPLSRRAVTPDEASFDALSEVENIVYLSGIYDVVRQFPGTNDNDLIDIHLEKNVIQVFTDLEPFIRDAKNLRQIVLVSSQSVNRALSNSKQIEIQLEDLVYGLNKFLAERLIVYLTQSSPASVLSLRVGTVFGPGEPKHRLANQVLLSFAQGREFVVSNSNHLRNYIYVDDLADAIWNLTGSDFKGKDSVINISGIHSFTIQDYVIALGKHWESRTSRSPEISLLKDLNYSGELEMLNDYSTHNTYTPLLVATQKIVEHFMQESLL